VLHRIMQMYLMGSEIAQTVLDGADLGWRDRERMQFQLDNLIAAAAPTNNPALNPLGYKAVVDSGGTSVFRGIAHLARDLSTSPRIPSMVDPDAFSVGETVAITPGEVIYRSEVLELIHYRPSTNSVYATPMMMVPRVINKFYIVDIAPGRSMVEYFVAQGLQVFVISWRNPGADRRDWGYDVYCEAIIAALRVVEEITGSPSAHVFATCSGGMLATMAACYLNRTGGGQLVNTLTLGVTVLDQTHAGLAAAAMNPVTAEAAIRSSARKGYLDGAALAEMFAWLRPTDLVWRYWVNNYIEGRQPPPFDVLFWNADTTRLAAGLHHDMVRTGIENGYTVAGGVEVAGVGIDLSKLEQDIYVMAGITDHISPWQACYRSARLFPNAPAMFVLSSSGHIASLVNPPTNSTQSYDSGEPTQSTPEEWIAATTKQDGSWWPHYVDWLAQRSADKTPAPQTPGSAHYPPLGAAPGEYVLEP
jgi:polyhydroxyalkanoate synthase